VADAGSQGGASGVGIFREHGIENVSGEFGGDILGKREECQGDAVDAEHFDGNKAAEQKAIELRGEEVQDGADEDPLAKAKKSFASFGVQQNRFRTPGMARCEKTMTNAALTNPPMTSAQTVR